jgi:energy-coupling factor transporter ATP-binding protein EcfA2
MHWQVQDFKGLVAGDLSLSAGTLTVLAGANSSGKSSLLQTLLLTAQSSYHDGPIVLNGPLVRLGTASDLVRAAAGTNAIRLALTYNSDENEFVPVASDLIAELDLVASEDDATLHIQSLQIRVGAEGAGRELRLDKRQSRGKDLELVRSILGSNTSDVLHAKSLLRDDRRVLRTYVGFRGFVPTDIVEIRSDIEADYGKAARQYLDEIGVSGASNDRSAAGVIDIELLWPLREFARLLESELRGDAVASSPALHRVATLPKGNPYLIEDQLRSLSAAELEEAILLAARGRARVPYVRVGVEESGPSRWVGGRAGFLEARLVKRLGYALTALRSFASGLLRVAGRVQYLGPLRDEPRVVWNQ